MNVLMMGTQASNHIGQKVTIEIEALTDECASCGSMELRQTTDMHGKRVWTCKWLMHCKKAREAFERSAGITG